MTSTPQNRHSSQVFYLDGQRIIAQNVKQLHPRRTTVHRLELQTDSLPCTLPPSVSTVIVKQQKDGWDKEFRLEKEAYERLNELQGIVIPQLYGEGTFNGLPALILSDITMTNLYDLAHDKIESLGENFEILETRLMEALRKLYAHGAEYWDQKLDNFVFSDNDNGKVMIVDLEEVYFPDDIGKWETNVNLGGVGSLMSDFKDIRDRNREPSPVSFWMARPDDGGTLAKTGHRGSTHSLSQGSAEGRKLIALPANTEKEGMAEAISEKCSRSRKRKASQNLAKSRRKRVSSSRHFPQLI